MKPLNIGPGWLQRYSLSVEYIHEPLRAILSDFVSVYLLYNRRLSPFLVLDHRCFHSTGNNVFSLFPIPPP
jgi:hypothetical protein